MRTWAGGAKNKGRTSMRRCPLLSRSRSLPGLTCLWQVQG